MKYTRERDNPMEGRSLKISISMFVAMVMFLTTIMTGTILCSDKLYAETTGDITASSKYNTITIPTNIKRGTFSYIDVNGARYKAVKDKYSNFIYGYAELNTFNANEEFFQVTSINVKSIKKAGPKYNKTFKYKLEETRLAHEVYGTSLRLRAGKYKMTATFSKRMVSLPAGINAVYFVEKDKSTYEKTATFYVKSKVQFRYNKKYGKLAKAKRTKYLNPGEKFGKLPKPKTKKGYKFKGWYTKTTGGKKVKKSTKVPVKDDVILYARYVKK